MRIAAVLLLLVAWVALASGPVPTRASRLLRQGPDQPEPPGQPSPLQPPQPPDQPSPPQGPPSPLPAPDSIWDLISQRPDLTTLGTIIEAAGLVPLFNITTMTRFLTVLLPNNEAFASFFADMGAIEGGEQGQEVLLSTGVMTPVLMYHMTEGIFAEADFTPGLVLPMRSGDNVRVNSSWDHSIEIRDVAGRTAQVLHWDLFAGPGVGHIIDKVLLPVRPTTINEALTWSNLSAFQEVAVAAGYGSLLNSTSANVTLLVPSNEAFLRALPVLNLPNISSLAENRTLCREIISSHILLGRFPWWRLQTMQMMYLPTATSCATLYFEQEDYATPLDVYGAGSIVGQSAMLTDVDLVAGANALVHVLDDVLLPLARWGSKCRYAFGV